MGLCESCSTVKIFKTFIVVCLSLVFLQYLINLVTYRYVSTVLKGKYHQSNYSFGFIFPGMSDILKNTDILSEDTNSSRHVSLSEAYRTTVSVNVSSRGSTLSGNSSSSHGSTLSGNSSSSHGSTLSGNILRTSLGALSSTGSDGLCPLVPPKLVGPLATYKEHLSFDQLNSRYPEVKPGGRFKPSECVSRHRVAVVIPYRNREDQLKVLLNNLHPVLERQQLDYAIYVIDQALPSPFNRAMMMNIGFAEARKDYDFQCFIFHDVDLIPENDKNMYTCSENPRHLSVAIDKFKYRLPYATLFGGVSALSKEQMEKVNGFSNKYFGWGGEDDDMSKRVRNHGYKLGRAPIQYARYKMIKHGRDKTNSVNKDRFKLLYKAEKRMKTDGLNSLKYEVVKKEFRPLYTWVNVQVDEKAIMKS